MNLLNVMTEVAGRLQGVGGIRAFATPPDTASVPFANCGAAATPQGLRIGYKQGAGTGAWRMTLPVVVAVSVVDDRTGWAKLTDYMSDTSPNSVINALEDPDVYTNFDTLAVLGWEVDTLTMGDVALMAVTLDIDITG